MTIRSHDLHVGDIRGAMGEIASYHERDYLSPFFWFLRAIRLLAFLWPSLFVSPMMIPTIDLLLDFCVVQVIIDVQIYMFQEKHKMRRTSSEVHK
jgi:hypothetical protein